MLKALIRKQFSELFGNYFYNRKTGKPFTKKQTAARFFGFAVLCVFLCAVFALTAFGMGQVIEAGLNRLYFSLLGILAIIFGTFGSVFNTYAGLYRAKDNDLLLSMPIYPRQILASRLIGVVGLAFLYSGMIWLPAVVVYCILAAPVSVAVIAADVFLWIVISLFVSVLTCFLGWVVALVASKLKNKSFVIVLISLVCLGLYYVVCFRMGDFFENLLTNSASIDSSLNTWARLFVCLGEGACGNAVSLLIFTGVTAALCAVCFIIMSKSFYHITLRSEPAGTKKVYKEEKTARRDTKTALYMRELKMFTSSATYMMNCGLGLVMLLAVGVIVLIKADSLRTVLSLIPDNIPELQGIVCPVALLAVCFIASLNMISTPSVSLEGSKLWTLRTLPVSGKQILQSKLMVHVSIGMLPVCVATLFFGIALGCSVTETVLMVTFAFLFNAFTGILGLIIGVNRPSFNWTNEAYPIKQSANVLIVMLICWVASIVLPGLCWLGGRVMDQTLSLMLTTVLLALICFVLLRVMNTRSADKFDRL
ncbi:MAG: hypothetical protein MJ142_07750 [Clostridia bacterium]|nr:hypothetical protein [Clostridia bacterium]